MKLFLWLWLTPVTLLGAWYGLSANDMSFGVHMLSRETHDLVFAIYGQMLGIAPEKLPPLVLRAVVLDTFIVLAIIAYRRRSVLVPWMKRQWSRAGSRHKPMAELPANAPAHPAE